MIALAQDLLAAGVAVALYALGIRLFLGRCQRLAPPAQPFPPSSHDNRHAMRTQQPAAEPTNVSAISIAAGMGSIAALCALALVACARAHGVM
ncbi:Cobalt transporter [Methylorubrum aminovorans]